MNPATCNNYFYSHQSGASVVHIPTLRGEKGVLGSLKIKSGFAMLLFLCVTKARKAEVNDLDETVARFCSERKVAVARSGRRRTAKSRTRRCQASVIFPFPTTPFLPLRSLAILTSTFLQPCLLRPCSDFAQLPLHHSTLMEPASRLARA